MKLSGARIEAFVKKPDPKAALVLVYGPDQGLVKERGEAVAKSAVDDLGDPFRVADLSPDDLKNDPARLDDEARALSMMGGRRLVRVRGAGEAVLPAVKNLLEGEPFEALVVIEAGDLPAKSGLRKLVETAEQAAALPCYADGAGNLEGLIRETLAAEGFRVSRDAQAYLVHHLGSDRLISRGELVKLALYKASADDGDREITLTDAMAVVGDNALSTLDDAIQAAFSANTVRLDEELERAFANGQSPVAVLRAAQRHLGRLYQVSAAVAGGTPSDVAIKGLRPPLFFKAVSAFQAQLNRWRPDRLGQAFDLLTEAEIQAKSTGLPDAALCQRALIRIAQLARR
ncbi:MAG: DNA polymerase III subunit delta [Rhodospirillales bacterium]